MANDVPEMPMRVGTIDLPRWVLVRAGEVESKGLGPATVPLGTNFGDTLALFTTEEKAREFIAGYNEWDVYRFAVPAEMIVLVRHFQAFGVPYVGIDLPNLRAPGPEHTLAPIGGFLAAVGG